MGCGNYCNYLDHGCNSNNHCNHHHKHCNVNTLESSFQAIQTIQPNNPLNLGSAILGTANGNAISFDGTNLTLNVPGLYLVSYSTSAVWTTLPYGTNEAIVQLQLNGSLLPGSRTIGTVVTPAVAHNQKLNLATTVIVPVTNYYVPLKLINVSSSVMDFENTTITIIKIA